MSSRALIVSLAFLLLLSLVGCGVKGSDLEGAAPVAAPAFAPPGGSYVSPQTVTITTLASGAFIRYTLDNSAPTTTHGTLYASPVTISATGTLKAIAFLNNRESAVTFASYVIAPLATNHAPTAVSLVATVYPEVPHPFTLQGTDPDSDPLTFALASQPLHGALSGTPPNLTYTGDAGHLGADSFTFTVSDGEFTSAPATVTFTAVVEPTLSRPTITPSPLGNPRLITLTATPNTASIRYTLDGSTPTATHGTLYVEPFPLYAESTVKAVAYESGVTSPVTSQTVYVNAVSTPDVDVHIYTPDSKRAVGDSVFIAAQVTALVELDAVWARVGERSVNLVYDPEVYCPPTQPGGIDFCYSGFGGTLNLAGLPVGLDLLTVTARDHLGREGSHTINITHDAPPTLTVLSPLSGVSAHPTMTVSATCADDEGECLVGVRVSGGEVLIPPAPYQVDTLVDFTAFSGRRLPLEFYAADPGGHVVLSHVSLLVEAAQNLEAVATVAGEVLDFDGVRVLSLIKGQTGQTLRITRVSDGAVEDHALPTGFEVTDDVGGTRAYLTPVGAVAMSQSPGPPYTVSLTSWENGQEVALGTGVTPSSLRVKGGWAVWDDGALYRRSFTDGVTQFVAGDAGNWNNDVTQSGAVAFWTSTDYAVKLFDGTQTKLLASDQYRNVYPRTDGTLTAYVKLDADLYAIALHDGQAETVLRDFSTEYAAPDEDYQLGGGMVYFRSPGTLGQKAVWRREGDGTVVKLTFFATDTALDSVGGDGAAMVVNGYDRYLVGLDGNLVKISGGLGRTLQLGGQWYLLLGDWVGKYK